MLDLDAYFFQRVDCWFHKMFKLVLPKKNFVWITLRTCRRGINKLRFFEAWSLILIDFSWFIQFDQTLLNFVEKFLFHFFSIFLVLDLALISNWQIFNLLKVLNYFNLYFEPLKLISPFSTLCHSLKTFKLMNCILFYEIQSHLLGNLEPPILYKGKVKLSK